MKLLRPRIPPVLSLGQVAGFLGAPTVGESLVSLTGVSLDSRAVQPRDLFAALPGAATHGAFFAPAALRAGASAILTDDAGASLLSAGTSYLVVPNPRERLGPLSAWFYGFPARDVRLAGVTGTTGKTTVTWLIEAAMREAWGEAAVLGTVATRIGQDAAASARTTLEAPDLHAAFAAMRERGIQGCAMEVSSHALVEHRVDGIECDVAVLTNLARDHLDYHGTLEEYHGAKARLFTPGHARLGVVWAGDALADRLGMAASIPVVRVGPGGAEAERVHPAPDWVVERRGTVMDDGVPAQGFALTGPMTIPAATRLIGDFNLVNAALALAAAVNLGIDPHVAARGISRLDSVPGRMELLPGPKPGPAALVDFAHTPGAITAALGAARRYTEGRLIAVLGAGGGRDQGKRVGMGEAAAQGADVVIVTDDNPRHEDPGAIRAEILAGAVDGAGEVREVPDRAEAIRAAVAMAGPRDTVAVLGKGHETGQAIGDRVVDFEDRAVLGAALVEHGPWT
jgi:UDP-N-acetylmuramoyl-L-alanyl-D-glutamate--2,6-diaminopimelate ligase